MVGSATRHSLYSVEDIERVKARSSARVAESVAASGALRYGEPVVPTSVTEITPQGPRYRNRLAIDLACEGAPFECTAELLWTGRYSDLPKRWRADPLPATFLALTQGPVQQTGAPDITDLFAICTLSLGISKGRPIERGAHSASQIADAIELLQALSGCFAMISTSRRYRPLVPGESIAEAIARSAGISSRRSVIATIDAALTLCADHELNPATFVARIGASTEVDLHSGIAAAISTASGAQVARRSDRIEALLKEAGDAQALIREIGADGPSPVARLAFGHPLYRDGDPRGRTLLAILKANHPDVPELERSFAFVDHAARRHKLAPRIEFALAALAVALRMPPGSAAGLYILARIAGWVAHMHEQGLAGFIIRPRARYTHRAAT
jgi:citrate synthase